MVKLIGAQRVNTAVFISGNGSNLKSLILNSLKKNSKFKISLIISNNSKAKGLNFANKYKIKKKIVNYKFFSNAERTILKELEKNNIDLVCLAGYMKILSSNFIKSFKGTIINIHPSLLPKYKGLNTHQRAMDNNDKFCGCTVHFVNSKLDSGKIILQKKVKIFKNDTVKKIKKRVLKQEHLLYPKAVLKVIFNL
mgnify:CR=1 FL=1